MKKLISLTLINYVAIIAMVFSLDRILLKETVVDKKVSSGVIQKTNIPKQNNLSSKQSVSGVVDAKILVPTPTIVVEVMPDTRCLIMIDSKKYDVTVYRNIHGGGDVFKCGTDMTAEFYSRHTKEYLAMMEKYKIQ